MTATGVLGVDIGGVLVHRAGHDTDTSFFGDRPMETPPVAGCFAALRSLAEMFDHEVHIISKAGPRVEAFSLDWLQLHGVFDYVPRRNVWFVRKRPEKAPICHELGVTHFIAARLDVLQHLHEVPYRIWFVGGSAEVPTMRPPRWAARCATWRDVSRFVVTTHNRLSSRSREGGD